MGRAARTAARVLAGGAVMAAPQFTPGPWFVNDDDECVYVRETGDAHEPAICTLIGPDITAIGDARERAANLSLIAAAPDLYTVLGAAPIVSQYHGVRGFETERFIADYQAWTEKRRAALAKAEATP